MRISLKTIANKIITTSHLSWLMLSLCLLLPEAPLLAQNIDNSNIEITRLLRESQAALNDFQYNKAIALAKQSLDTSNLSDNSVGTINSLLLIGDSFKLKGEHSRSLNHYLQALSEIEKTNKQEDLYRANYKIGVLFYEWGVPEKAIIYFNNAQSHGALFQERINKVTLLNRIAETHLKLNKYSESLDYYQKVLSINKEIGNKQMTINTLKKTASIHHQLNEFENALNCNFEIVQLHQQMQDSANIAISLNTIGFLYKDLNDLPKSLEYFNQALAINNQMNRLGLNDNSIVSNLINIGVIHQSLGDYRNSIKSFNNALEIKEKNGTQVEVAVMNNYMASIHFSLQNYSEAKKHTIKAIELLEGSDNKRLLANNYKRLSELHQKLGDNRSALDSYKHYSLLKDSLLYQEQLSQEREQYKQFVVETTEKESKLVIIDQEIRALELRNEKVKSEKEKQEIQLLLREKELQNSSLRNEQLRQDRQVQELLLQQEQIETESKDQEITLLEQKRDLQAVELLKNELLKNERQKEIELQNSRLDLQQAELERGEIRQTYLIWTAILFFVILILILVSYFIKQRDNRKLQSQYIEINNQKGQIEDINKELIELNEEKNDLIGIVAHDLKSPLNQIGGILDLIKLTAKDQTKEQQEYIIKIDDSAQRLKKMVTKILDVNAIESKTLNLNMEETKLHELLKQMISRFKEMAESKELTVIEQIDENISSTSVDTVYISEVFENLLSNAVKYSPIGKIITVRLHQVADYVRTEFQDEGQGINEKDMKKLFGKYHKLSARPTAGEDSTGLGLSIVKKYVEAMKGRVWCESEEGKGANFIVEFSKT